MADKTVDVLDPEFRDGLPNNYDRASREQLDPDEESQQGSIARLRVLTRKGKEYRRDLLQREFARTLKLWRVELENAESALADTSDMSTLQQKRNALEASMGSLAVAYDNLANLLSTSEIGELTKRYDTFYVEHREIFKALNSKILEIRSERNSTNSGHSKNSRSSHQASVVKRAEMLTRAARLETELKFLEAEQKKAAELKKIQLMKEIATNQAEIEVVEKLEEENVFDLTFSEGNVLEPAVSSHERVQAYLNNQIQTEPIPIATEADLPPPQINDSVSQAVLSLPKQDDLNPEINPFVPTPATTTHQAVNVVSNPILESAPAEPSHDPHNSAVPRQLTPDGEVLAKLVDLLSQRNNHDSLPRAQPEVFDGNLLRYPTWIKSFETFIERKTSDPSERLFYLGRFTSGEAREAINGLLSLNTERAFAKAKKILSCRFGNPFLVSNAYRKKLDEWPKIPANDGASLRKFSDFLQHCCTAMAHIKYLSVLDDPEENKKILKKLPSYIVNRWSRIVDKSTSDDPEVGPDEESDEPAMNLSTYPTFKDFCRFLKTEARIACHPVTNQRYLKSEEIPNLAKKKGTKPGSIGARCFATGSNDERSGRPAREQETQANQDNGKAKPKCIYCKEEHELDTCAKFIEISIPNRRAFIISKRLCWGCLKWGHSNRSCRRKKSCRTCGEVHPTALHGDKRESNQTKPDGSPKPTEAPKPDDANSQQNTVSNCIEVHDTKASDEPVSHSLIVPVWVHHSNDLNKKILTYALLDNQSDACFIKDSTLNELGIDGPEIQLELSTVLAQEKITSKKITGLVVRGVNQSVDISLPRTYSRDIIPARQDQIPRRETAETWPHLRRIASQLTPLNKNIKVGLLIGANCTHAIKPREVLPGNDNDPYGIRTALGWGIIGPITHDSEKTDNGSIQTHRIVTREVVGGKERTSCQFVLKTRVKEILTPAQVSEMFEFDFNDRGKSNPPLSYNDRLFMKRVNEEIHQRDDGHFEIPLPLKNPEIKLPNNKSQAVNRLIKLKDRFGNDQQYQKDYLTFMEGIIKSGYAERVPDNDLTQDNGNVWYLPHHGVYNHKKPGKIRVVFDCSAEFKGESLNSHLLQGPDLTNNLLGVLVRFRQERTAIMCDIESMFHQVHVNVEHRDLLRFLWWPDGDINRDPAEYRMTVHLFGATSSPGCANIGLKTTADVYEKEFGNAAASFVRNDFYVDDGLKSVPSPGEAVELMMKTKALCERGGFHLHKLVSNSKEVLQSFPPDERASGIRELDLVHEKLPIERALGVQWCVESDTLQFKIEMIERPATRRGVLSTVSSIFDPLGLLSPLLLEGKRILQELCKQGTSWDEKIPDSLQPRWTKWQRSLRLLSTLQLPRCYKPQDFGKVKTVELHNFSDASSYGYGQCSYLRLVDDENRIYCTLVMAKSRVASLKPITIPRLELTAALVSAKVSAFLQKELEYDEMKIFYWTDSKVILGYIANDARRFHVFVSNRVQQIRDLSLPSQWRYVDTKSNPADYASRGMSAEDIISKTEWWNGPKFLWEPIDYDQGRIEEETTALSPEDPETKKLSSFAVQAREDLVIADRLRHLSNWHKAKKAIAVCLRFREKLIARMHDETACEDRHGRNLSTKDEASHRPDTSRERIDVEDLLKAEKVIVKNVQERAFNNELAILQSLKEDNTTVNKRNKKLKGASTLSRLDPFVDRDGIIRVGGRLRRAELPDNVKHPCILPKKGHVTELIICYHHHRIHHQGRGMTLAAIRSSGFWIVSGGSAVARHISKCVTCRKLRAATQGQKMADLPKDRTEPSQPFTYSAVDYFGPWLVKESRREVKRYGVLFTCMASRAVHNEIAHSMDTSSFINAYRRFVGRRGPVRQLRSDRGTNFVGCQTELKNALLEMDDERIRKDLLEDQCDWINAKMNVPHASHMGGVWERQIRTIRSALSALLDHHGARLDDELLQTLMVEAEAIVNSRPLTVDSTSPLEPLSPNHLLTSKTNVVLPPPGVFQRADLYSRKRWRRVQHLANEFWDRWRKEFLQSLQMRQKWLRPKRNLKTGDIVIVQNEELPRNRWQLARVQEVYTDSDGLVRKVKIEVGDRARDNNGKRVRAVTVLERPVHKLVLLLAEEEGEEDRGFPNEEP